MTIKQIDDKFTAELDLGLSLSKALGSLRKLGERANDPKWAGSIDDAVAILESLNAVQVAVKARQKLIDLEREKA